MVEEGTFRVCGVDGEGVDLEGGGGSVRVVDRGGDEAVEGGDGAEPPDGVNGFGLGESVEVQVAGSLHFIVSPSVFRVYDRV